MRKIFLIVMFLTVTLGLSFTNAFADGAKARHLSKPISNKVIVANSRNHYNHAGRFLRLALFRSGPKNHLAIGVVVTRLPYGHRTIRVRGSTYHLYGGTYYKACRLGYMVVPAPC
ncbi:MAG: DUF6515 family protein [Candidatus Omnitrophota bacterium]